MSDWTADAACAGLDVTPWYPTKGTSILPAQRICSTCPVQRDCLVESLSETKIHYASAEGVRGGIGGQGRRAMIAALRDCDHPPTVCCEDPDCRFCELLGQHRVNLDVIAGLRPKEDRVRIVAFGAGATHGRQVTHARGCRCAPCVFARSTIGQEMAAAGFDVVEWFQTQFGPIPEREGEAPFTTAEWSELDEARAVRLAALAKQAGRRFLDGLAVAA